MTKSELINLFQDTVLAISEKSNENEIQNFLEENTELIPTPYLSNHRLHFDCIISKLSISESLTCDFAYLT